MQNLLRPQLKLFPKTLVCFSTSPPQPPKPSSLFSRLGGEKNLFIAIDLFTEKVLADQALRRYFIKRNDKFITDHQQRAILVSFGGTSGFSDAEIKRIHAPLHLHDKELTLYEEHLRTTFQQMGLDESNIEEALSLVDKHRKRIVSDTLFDKIGGDSALQSVVSKFYEKVWQDNELKYFFTSLDPKRIIAHQERFLGVCFGKTKSLGKFKEKDLKLAHVNFHLSDRHFFLFKLHLAQTLKELGHSEEEVIHPALHVLEKFRNSVLNRKTPYEQIGGKESLALLIEHAYLKIRENPIMKPYFTDKSMDRIKNGMLWYLTKALGGPQNEENPLEKLDLKVSHAKMSLSDSHLDAFRACFEKVLKEQNMEPSVVRDVLWALEVERREVISNTIYDIIGGEETVTKVTQILLKKVRAHYILGKFFASRTDDELMMILRFKLVYALGGPRPFRGRDIRSAHCNVVIKQQQLNDMKFLIVESLKEAGVCESIIVQLMRTYDSKKNDILSNGGGFK